MLLRGRNFSHAVEYHSAYCKNSEGYLQYFSMHGTGHGGAPDVVLLLDDKLTLGLDHGCCMRRTEDMIYVLISRNPPPTLPFRL